jgi:hypothetical protein
MYSLTSNQNIQTTSSDATNASVSQINSNNSPINSVETSIGYKKSSKFMMNIKENMNLKKSRKEI